MQNENNQAKTNKIEFNRMTSEFQGQSAAICIARNPWGNITARDMQVNRDKYC